MTFDCSFDIFRLFGNVSSVMTGAKIVTKLNISVEEVIQYNRCVVNVMRTHYPIKGL